MRAIAVRMGLSRDAVARAVASSSPPRYSWVDSGPQRQSVHGRRLLLVAGACELRPAMVLRLEAFGGVASRTSVSVSIRKSSCQPRLDLAYEVSNAARCWRLLGLPVHPGPCSDGHVPGWRGP